MLDALPTADLREAVTRAIEAAFPGQPVEGATKVAAGLSGAAVYRLTVAGTPYLLRAEVRRGGLWDPERQYACQRVAADVGVAPPVVFVDAKAGVAISQFVESTPMHLVDRQIRRDALVAKLRDLHAAPLFPPADVFAGMAGVWELARSTSALPATEVERLHTRFRAVLADYPADEPRVSAHHDVNPSNVLFEGSRAWLVDWEVAGAGDRFFDLASAGHWFCADEAEETALLDRYFGRPATAAEWARYRLMQALMRLVQGMLFVQMAARQEPGWQVPPEDRDPLPLATLRPRLGELMATPGGRARFGMACLREAERATEGPAYREHRAAL